MSVVRAASTHEVGGRDDDDDASIALAARDHTKCGSDESGSVRSILCPRQDDNGDMTT